MSKPITTPINQLPEGEYNMILRHKLIVTPNKKFMQMTYSPTSKKISGELKQLVMIEDNTKQEEPEVSEKTVELVKEVDKLNDLMVKTVGEL